MSPHGPRLRAVLPWACALFVALAASTARAEPTEGDKDVARSLMVSGVAKREKGDARGALRDFQSADAIMHVPSTGIEVATTLAALGFLLEARDATAAVLRLPEARNEPAPFVDARKKARELQEELDAKIPSLTIHVERAPNDAPPSALYIDERPEPLSILETPRKMNPGRYAIRVEAGEASSRATVELREGAAESVTLSPAPDAPDAEPEAPLPRGSRHGGGGVRAVGYAGLVLGATGLAVGAVTGLMVLSNREDLDQLCRDNVCPPGPATDKLDTTRTLSAVATVSFVVGGVALGAGIVALVLGKKDDPAPASARRLQPWIGLGGAGVRGSF